MDRQPRRPANCPTCSNRGPKSRLGTHCTRRLRGRTSFKPPEDQNPALGRRRGAAVELKISGRCGSAIPLRNSGPLATWRGAGGARRHRWPVLPPGHRGENSPPAQRGAVTEKKNLIKRIRRAISEKARADRRYQGSKNIEGGLGDGRQTNN